MPLKIPVGRIGEWKHPRYGVIKMSQQTFDDIVRNFKSKALGRDPYIRVGHDKADDLTFGSTKSEGWITDLVQEGDVLYALADPTNDEIGQKVNAKVFRYSSPEYQNDYRDKETGESRGAVLEALALTNSPFLTKLPDAILLSDPVDTFYLDHEEVQKGMDKMDQLIESQNKTQTMIGSFLTKLSDMFTGGKGEQTPTPAPAPAAATPPAQPDPTTVKLSEQVAQLQAENRRIAVEAKLSGYVQQGIPPAVIDQYRPILLSDTGAPVIKLSDDKMITLSDQVYAALDAFPKEGRIDMTQRGQQGNPPAAGSPEEIKKLCDQDMTELGFSVNAQGRYVMGQ